METKRTLIKHLIALLVFIFLLVIEFFFRKPLFLASIQYQLILQQSWTDSRLEFFEMLSLWGDGFPYVVTIMLVFTWDSRAKAFYYLLFLTLNVGL